MRPPLRGTSEGPTFDVAVQRATALAGANAIRVGVANECDRLATLTPEAAVARAIDLLDGAEHPLDRMPVGRLLEALPRVGPAQVRRLLLHAGISLANIQLRNLTVRQTETLALALRLPTAERHRLAMPGSKEDELRREVARLTKENRVLRAENYELGSALEGRAA